MEAEIRAKSRDGLDFLERMMAVASGEVLYTETRTTAKGEVYKVEVRANIAQAWEANVYLFERLCGKTPDITKVEGRVDHVHQDGRLEQLRKLTPEQWAKVKEANRILREALSTPADFIKASPVKTPSEPYSASLNEASALSGPYFQRQPDRTDLDPETREGGQASDPAALGSTGRASSQEDRDFVQVVAVQVATGCQDDPDDDPFAGDE